MSSRMRTLSRRLVIGGAAATAALSVVPSLHRQAVAQDDARALLDKAAQAMTEVTSFKFLIRNEDGTTMLMNIVELEAIEGAVLRPDRFQATATAQVAVMNIDVHIIGIGNDIYVSDPTSASGSYIQIPTDDMTGVDIASVINPDTLVLRSVTVIEDPEIDGDDEIDDVDTTIISGHFTVQKALDLTGLIPATPPADAEDSMLLLDEPLDVNLWIDDEGLVRRVRIIGPILNSDDPGIARRIDLFDFNEPIEIEPPANATPISEMEE